MHIAPGPRVDSDVALLFDATSHSGAFSLKSGAGFSHPLMQRAWENIHVSERRWRLEAEPIFADGLSTAVQISELSGRGVGMAAVKAVVESLGGRLTLRSEPGKGTAFDITVGPQAAVS